MGYLDHFSEEERQLLIKLPYRAGLWISASDTTGGDESDEAEKQALASIVRGFTEDFLKSEFVEAVMRESAARLRQRGPEFEAAAAHLELASTHWMRHTAGSHLSEKADIKVVRDNLGHANISTTSVYLHSEDDARHDATAAVHRVGWATT